MALNRTSLRAEKALFLILAVYLVLLTIQIRKGERSIMGNLALSAFGPVKAVTDGAIRITREGLQAYFWQRDAALSAERLSFEKMVLEGEILAGRHFQEENRRLRRLLDLPVPSPYKPAGGRALTQYGVPFNRYVMISVDPALYVSPLTPVITPEGVVGRVEGGQGGLLRCVLVTDPGSAIGVVSQRSFVHGVAAGEGVGLSLRLRWVTNEADVRAGDLFVTSGDDGVFPPGIPVGKVVSVEDGPDYLKRATLSPAAGLDRLQWLLLLLRP